MKKKKLITIVAGTRPNLIKVAPLIRAIKKYKSLQKGDVENTFSDSSLLEIKTGFKPNTSIKKGIKNFVNWYKEYNNL